MTQIAMKVYFDNQIKPKVLEIREILGIKTIEVTYIPTEDKFVKTDFMVKDGEIKLTWEPF